MGAKDNSLAAGGNSAADDNDILVVLGILDLARAALDTVLGLPAVAARALRLFIDRDNAVAILVDPVVPVVEQALAYLFLDVCDELDDNSRGDAGLLAFDDLGVAAIVAVPGTGLAEVVLVGLAVGVGLGRVAVPTDEDLACCVTTGEGGREGGRRREAGQGRQQYIVGTIGRQIDK